MKIVLIGAGSNSFGLKQVVDILATKDLRGRKVTLSLVDENEETLDRMFTLSKRIAKHNHSDVKLEADTRRTKVLKGADYVITAVARKRYPLWEQDYRVPMAYGFKQVLGENGGPGALFHTLRSLNLLMPICADVEKLCPDAWFFNFTNPEARVLHSLSHLTKVRAAGFCHGVFATMDVVSKALKIPQERLKFTSAGINHFYTLLSVRDLKTGDELLPKATKLILAKPDPKLPPLWLKLLKLFGIMSYPSDDHIAEYLSYGTPFTGLKWHYGQESKPVTLSDSANSDWKSRLSGPWDAEAKKRLSRPSSELTVPIICDIEMDRGHWREAVNVLNTGGYISNLPESAAVEIPAMPNASGLNPQHVGPLPETLAAYTRLQCSIHALITEAWKTKSKDLLLQALLLDPVVNDWKGAEGMLDEMLGLQREFIPKFS